MSIPKNQSVKSAKRQSVYESPDRTIPWPENPHGFVVSGKELKDFIGMQTVYHAQATARRFAVVAEAGLAISSGEEVKMNWQLIHLIMSEDHNTYYQRVMRAMIEAIRQGKEGARRAYATVVHLWLLGFGEIAWSTTDEYYKKRVERMKRRMKQRR